MEGSIFTVLIYSFLWSSLYFILCLLNPKRSYEWHCRTVTAIHATVVSLLSCWCGFVQGPWPFTDAGGQNTPLQLTTVSICLGYFLFDLTWCLYFQSEGGIMLLHHVLSIMGLSVSVVSGWYGTEMIATIFGSEVTNPLLQTRWFLKETDQYNTLLGEIVDHAFMFSFGFFRIGIGSYLIYCYFQQPTDFFGRLGATVMYGISWLFWISIVQFAVGKYKKKFRNYQRRKLEEKGQGDRKCNGTIGQEFSKISKSGDVPNGKGDCDKDIAAKLHQNGIIKHDSVLSKDVHYRGPLTNGIVNGSSNIQLNPAF